MELKKTNIILYDSQAEYNLLCCEFKTELPVSIRNYNIDVWTYTCNGNEKFGLSFSNYCEEVIQKLLFKLTKNQNENWVINTSYILSSAIRGLAKSISYINKTECLDIFKKKEICNIMIINMINNILFDTESDLCGCENVGEIEKIKMIKCIKCNNYYNLLADWDNLCFNCYESNFDNFI